MRWIALAVVVICSALAMAADGVQEISTPLISVRYRPHTGNEIRFGGVPLIRGTSVQLYAPGWKEGYYSSNNDQPPAELGGDRATISIQHAAPKVKFNATETLRKMADDKLELSLQGVLESGLDARIEWSIGYVNAFALYGGGYEAIHGPSTQPGAEVVSAQRVIPEPTAKRGDATVITAANGVLFHSRAGRISVNVEEGGTALALMDGRRSPSSWWGQETPSFWLGFPAFVVKPHVPFHLRVVMTFIPGDGGAAVKPETHDAPVVEIADALSPSAGPIQIIPKPKRASWSKGRFVLSPGTKLIAVDQSAQSATRVLAREASVRFDWDWKPQVAESKGDLPTAIYFVHDNSGSMPPEGYSIDIRSDSLVVSAATRAGHFYAAQTLAQLFEVEGNEVYFPGGHIDDWPSLAFRGVHLFTGKDAMDFHRKLTERIFRRFKFNNLVLESDYTQWKTDSKLWSDLSVPRDQVAQYVKLARENNLQPIPLVQSLGHAQWMFANGENLDLAEYAPKPYAYDATNPQTYEFIRKIYAETFELFGQPKFFHIGHDEVTIMGNYPARDQSREWGVTKLLLNDIRQLNEFFKPRGTRMMMWGDMLLHRSESNDAAANAENESEARARRDAIPRSTVICDWHYQPAEAEAYKSLKIFHDEGFTTIACPWFNPQNIYTISQAARMYGAWGTLQTTWAGYSITEETLHREFKQFAAYVLAAEYAWSGDSPAPGDLPYRAEDVFLREINRGRQPVRVLGGKQVDLSHAVNLSLEDWLGYGADANLSSCVSPGRLDGISFNQAGGALPAIALRGALLPPSLVAPGSITLTMDIKADELAFLQTTAFPATKGEQVGKYEAIYADESRVVIPLEYGIDVRVWDDGGASEGSSLVCAGKTGNGVNIGLRLMRWKNPHPEKAIKKIIFSTTHAYASPILLGITAINQ